MTAYAGPDAIPGRLVSQATTSVPPSGNPDDDDAPRAAVGAARVAATDTTATDHGHSSLDRLARRVLGLRDAEPRALIDLQGSLVLSAVRCLITYVFIPVILPVIAWAGVVARPIGLVLAVVAVAMSIRSLRRVWQANWTHRWPYTAFIGVVVGLLAFSIVLDIRSFLA